MSFPSMNPALARALAAHGYDTPTAVQLAVLGDGAVARDQLVSAQTGSGKTVAFGLALGATLLGDQERLPAPSQPLALIVAPTRELALQVCRELTWLYEAAGARVMTCVGGMDPRAEARQLGAGAHIVVGTPGRLRDHLERGRLVLTGLRAVVLDEADEMLDLGFREDLEFILDATPAERRTLLFSATVPREIEALARRYQRDAVRIETGRRDQQHADIEYLAHRVVAHDVENTIVNVLRYHEARAALVFCATREAVNRVSARLIERGFQAVALSGELTQHERTKALQALRDGRARVLVATDVAARGLDLPDLHLVIHADLPNDGETLLHRSGRTGRAGRKGLCVVIVPFNRRRKADVVMAAARIRPTWRPAPSAEEVRARDQERFLADSSFTVPASDDETQLVVSLRAAHTAEEIALALVRMQGARLPPPEDLAIDTGPPPRRAWQERSGGDRAERPRAGWHRDEVRPAGRWTARTEANAGHETSGTEQTGAGDRDVRPFRPRREDSRPMTWFRINIGRNRNADPRWLLPLICRAGGVSKSEIGAIRVDERETRFQIISEAADHFELRARTAKEKEGHIVRAAAGTSDIETVSRAIEAIAVPPEGPPSATHGPDTPAGQDHKDQTARKDGEGHKGRKAERKAGHKAGHKAGNKDRWRGGAKPEGAGGWSSMRRPGKPHGKAGSHAKSAAHADRAPTRPAAKHAKKKHRPAAPASGR